MHGKLASLIAFLSINFISCVHTIDFDYFLRVKEGEGLHSHYIKNVPFYKQRSHYCGPSALASVLNYYGIGITPEKIGEDLRTKSLAGSLNLDMLLYPRRFGLLTRMLKGDIDELQEYIKNDIPVILLVDDGFSIYSIFHYVVLIGFNSKARLFVAHWGVEPNRVVTYEKLYSQWKKAGSWGFAVRLLPWEDMTAEEHNDLGVAYENSGKLKEAEKEYLESHRLNNNFCEPVFNLGNIYFKMSSYDKAEEWFLRALKICVSKGDVYNNLAYLYLKLGRIDEAKEFIMRALEISPEDPIYTRTLREINEAGGSVSP